MKFENAFQADLLVESQVIVELKSVEKLSAAHHEQVLTYVRILDIPIGLLINVGAPTIKEGLHRIVNSRHPAIFPQG